MGVLRLADIFLGHKIFFNYRKGTYYVRLMRNNKFYTISKPWLAEIRPEIAKYEQQMRECVPDHKYHILESTTGR